MTNMKAYFFALLLFFTSIATADWSISKFFLNKVPLKSDVKNDISQFFIAQIQVDKMGLNCFPKAKNKPQALICAKLSDKKMAALMNAADKDASFMQDKVNQSTWNERQKALLISEIKINLKRSEKSVSCLNKAFNMGDLDRCFKH